MPSALLATTLAAIALRAQRLCAGIRPRTHCFSATASTSALWRFAAARGGKGHAGASRRGAAALSAYAKSWGLYHRLTASLGLFAYAYRSARPSPAGTCSTGTAVVRRHSPAHTLFVGYRRNNRALAVHGGSRRKRPRRSQQEGCGFTIGVRKELRFVSSSYGRFMALCVRLPLRTHLSCWHLLYGHSGCAPACARAHIVCRLPPALPRFGGSRRLAAPWSLRRCFVSSPRGLLARSSRPRFSSSLRTCFALRFAGPSSRAWAGSVWPAIIWATASTSAPSGLLAARGDYRRRNKRRAPTKNR